ncbi:acyl-CoA dehydrogenase family protein [Lactiplantibacillus modestisalitolerans]|uniref:Acyl-CoA dehydrogenase family protein n=1 Tax=Lactiplantibacillus modestisalitolerans TaxID=1457219 RepID=A0ABV5WQT6_9LACO|nr:acyl-CoA dehydrogenase family protein [Lactiplantibacillus modestisalitolerans]
MTLHLTEKQALWWRQLRALKRQELAALASDVETHGHLSADLIAALKRAKLFEAGPSAERVQRQVLTAWAVSENSAGVGVRLITSWQVANLVAEYGTTVQKRALDANPIAALPNLAGDVLDLEPVAAVETADGWQLTGQFTTVINADLGGQLLIIAHAPADQPSAFLIPLERAGVQPAVAPGLLGLRGVAVADVRLDHVVVTSADRLGAVGAGITLMRQAQAYGRLLLTALMAGLYQRADHLVRVMAVREQPPLAELAPLTAQTQSLALLALNAASQADAAEDFEPAANLAGLMANRVGTAPLAPLFEILGPYAYSEQSPLLTLYRDLATLPRLLGTETELRETVAQAQFAQAAAPAATPTDGTAPERLAVADLHRVVKQLHLTHDVPVKVGTLITAKRLLVLGTGAQDPQDQAKARQLAKWIGAAVAVTPALAQASSAPLTPVLDRSVHPEVLLTVGVLGDDALLMNILGAQHVVAVSSNDQAPVIAVAQQAFVGRAADFLDGMIAALN